MNGLLFKMTPLERSILRPSKYIHDNWILLCIKYPHTTWPDRNLHFKVFNRASNITKQIGYHFHGLDSYNAYSGKLDLLLQGSGLKAFKGYSYIFWKSKCSGQGHLSNSLLNTEPSYTIRDIWLYGHTISQAEKILLILNPLVFPLAT